MVLQHLNWFRFGTNLRFGNLPLLPSFEFKLVGSHMVLGSVLADLIRPFYYVAIPHYIYLKNEIVRNMGFWALGFGLCSFDVHVARGNTRFDQCGVTSEDSGQFKHAL